MNPSTILIVDDDPNNLKMLFRNLQSANYKVLIAESGPIALRQLRSMTPDIILLDVIMPDMDGFAVCRQLKKMPETQNIPIIFMTSLNDIESKVRGFEVGGVDYLTKPLNLVEVLARLETHLSRTQLYLTVKQQAEQLQTEVEQRAAELQNEITQREAETAARIELYELLHQQQTQLQSLTQVLSENIASNNRVNRSGLPKPIKQIVAGPLAILGQHLQEIEAQTKAYHDPDESLASIEPRIKHCKQILAALQRELGLDGAEEKTDPIDTMSVSQLSKREIEVLRLTAKGKTSFEIAAALNISHNTARTYRYRINQKLGITDFASIVKVAMQFGLIK